MLTTLTEHGTAGPALTRRCLPLELAGQHRRGGRGPRWASAPRAPSP